MPQELLTLFGFYLAGLTLNLTPCVYPMISVTVSIFGGTKLDTSQKHTIFKATLYVLGIATMYSVLGFVAGATGGFFGAWLANRWVLAGIGVIMVVLALGMFGLYQFQLPSGLLQKMTTQRTSGYLGMYLAGLVVGVFAAPCIGPPIVALLTLVGTRSDPLYGFISFFILSLGLGTPYWILGVFSGLIKKLPRSGMWLVWMERVFGVVLLGVALYYFALAFFPKNLSWVVPIVLVLGGAYLGFIERAGNEIANFRRLKWLLGVVVVFLGLWLGYRGLQSAPVLAWEPYTPEKLAAYRKEGKPVALDFYADWCIPCHEMDRYTFSNANVVQALKPFQKMRVDVTRIDTAETKAILEDFNIVGVPTMIFFDERGEEVKASRFVGFLPPERFLRTIQPVVKRSRE